MSLTLGDNFSYQGAKPLDARLKYETVAAMKAVADATMYEGCLAYCSGTDKTYQWKSTNTVDGTTGKWREFTSGGGGGGGTSYTAGDGIDITNDVISTEKSASGDIDKIIDRYPTGGELVSIVNAFNKGDLYSTDERMIGQWIDGKPLYQQVVDLGTISNNVDKKVAVSGSLTMTVVNLYGILIDANGVSFPLPYVHDRTMSYLIAIRFSPSTGISMFSRDNTGINGSHAYAVIQYTKTTDSAVSIGEANDYSTTEKIIGTWIDGKPLYQKTTETVSPNAVNSIKKIIELESNCQIQNFFGFMGENGDIGNVNSRKPINYGNPNTGFYIHTYSGFGNDIHMLVTRSYEVNAPVWITVQYTKTT